MKAGAVDLCINPCWDLRLHTGKPELPSDFEDATWAKLQNAVHAVHSKQPVSCSLEELYTVSKHGMRVTTRS
jgi:hypothetical protein